MKTNLKRIGSVVMFAALVIGVGGCKKTETEQLSHYQSANHRILGTWSLKSSSDVTNTTINYTEKNDINGDEVTYSSTIKSTITLSGGTYTYAYDMTSNQVIKTQVWNLPPSTSSQISTNTIDSVVTYDGTFLGAASVSIYKDHSYNAVETTYSNQFGGDDKTSSSNIQITDNGVLTGISSDTIYLNMDKDVSTTEGSWSWNDEHSDLDRTISAGLLAGKIISLSSAELVIQENDKYNKTETDYTEESLLTFLTSIDPTNTKEGITTEITTVVTTRTYTETWKKTSSNTMP